MKKFVLILLALTSLRSFGQAAEFRGPNDLDKVITSRVMPNGTPFSLSRYRMPQELLELMGTWNNYLDEGRFRNGAPNALNMLLWYLNLTSFANEVAAECSHPTLPVTRDFAQTVNALCKWPQSAAKQEPVLQNFWLSVMGYDAPESEYIAWRDFFMSAPDSDRSGAEAVRAMTLALVMNPYFLLEN